jgi:hypothetical protein
MKNQEGGTGGHLVCIIVEIEKPTPELKGCITFIRKSGDAAVCVSKSLSEGPLLQY